VYFLCTAWTRAGEIDSEWHHGLAQAGPSVRPVFVRRAAGPGRPALRHSWLQSIRGDDPPQKPV